MNIKVYYIENNDFSENWLDIKIGFLIEIKIDNYGFKMGIVREDVDKYRPEHFHDISIDNIRLYEDNSEIDFLNDISLRVHERLDDVWEELKEYSE